MKCENARSKTWPMRCIETGQKVYKVLYWSRLLRRGSNNLTRPVIAQSAGFLSMVNMSAIWSAVGAQWMGGRHGRSGVGSTLAPCSFLNCGKASRIKICPNPAKSIARPSWDGALGVPSRCKWSNKPLQSVMQWEKTISPHTSSEIRIPLAKETKRHRR